MASLKGKVAIVTGASRGLGAAMALELANQGASVFITYASDSSSTKVDALTKQITTLPHAPKARSVKVDLTDPDAPNVVLSALDAWLGPSAAVDILVNNAGIDIQKPLAKITPKDYAASYDLNVRAPILLTGALVPRLQEAAASAKSRAAGGGNGSNDSPDMHTPGSRVINVGSVGGRMGIADLSLYCSSKAAMEGLTRAWAAELGGDGTTVNQVNPGPVPSDMLDRIPPDLVESQRKATPVQNRLGTPEEVARIVAWLASPAAGWVTGQVISASGGFAMY